MGAHPRLQFVGHKIVEIWGEKLKKSKKLSGLNPKLMFSLATITMVSLAFLDDLAESSFDQ